MTFTATILGCGSSGGVPRVGYGWGVCDPKNQKNRRSRCALLVQRRGEGGTTSVLVDTGPDMREQMLRADQKRLDGVILTHEHADHIHGLDDIRPLVIEQRRRMDVWMSEEAGAAITKRFGYIFTAQPGSSYPPIANERRIIAGRPFTIDGPGGPIEALSAEVTHGEITCTALRFGAVAYSSDLNHIPPQAESLFAGLDIWIIDALRPAPHPSHFCLEEALDWIKRMKPKRAILTNLHTDLDYATLKADLPPHIEPAYDGMTLHWS